MKIKNNKRFKQFLRTCKDANLFMDFYKYKRMTDRITKINNTFFWYLMIHG